MPQDSGLADVARTFGDVAAHELKRSLKRLGSRFYDLTTGSLVRVEPFTWYEAAGPSFRTRRWALTAAGAFALRDEQDGLGQLLALHAPLPVSLSPSDASMREALTKVTLHFVASGERMGTERDLAGVSALRITNGVLSLDLVRGDADDGGVRHVRIALATGAVRVESGSAWETQRQPFSPLDDNDDATEHIKTMARDPDSTFDDGMLSSATDNEDD